VDVQIEAGTDACRVGAGTDPHDSAIDVEVVDQLRDEELRLCEDGGSDVFGSVQNENDVDRKLGNLS